MKNRDKVLYLIPIFGWLFIAYGIAFPIENIVIRVMWYIDIFLSCIVHPAQLFIAIPIGKKGGFSVFYTSSMTLVFGATWWKPLRKHLSEA